LIKANLPPGDDDDGHCIYRCNRGDVAGGLRVGNRLREIGRTAMSTFYIIGAVVSVGLLVYLVAALLKAEDL
jgi:K+-transporting ATPase KdpF subunit